MPSSTASKCPCGAPVKPIGAGVFKITPALCPACAEKEAARYEAEEQREKMERLFEFSGLSRADREWLDPRKVLAEAVAGVRRAVAWRYGQDGLYLWGPAGCGKTVAAKHLVLRCLYHGKHAVFVSVPGLLSGLRESWASSAYKLATATVRRATRYPLAVLDDLGAEQPSEKNREALYSIIDGRINRRLPIIITSNLEPAELFTRLDDKPGRIVDRIIGACRVIYVDGESFRVRAARERGREGGKSRQGDAQAPQGMAE